MSVRPQPRPVRLAGAGLALVFPAALLVVVAAPAALAQQVLPAGCVESGEQVVCTYDTPGSYDFAVPDGVTKLTVATFGAAGGEYNESPGGRGGSATAPLDLVAGTPVQVNVGGHGGAPDAAGPGAGGANGGAPGGRTSAFFHGSGGGAGANPARGTAGGAGGGEQGEVGEAQSAFGPTDAGGAGGTQTTGGAGGTSTPGVGAGGTDGNGGAGGVAVAAAGAAASARPGRCSRPGSARATAW